MVGNGGWVRSYKVPLHVFRVLFELILLTLSMMFWEPFIYTDENTNLEISHLKSVKMNELSNNVVVMAVT